MMSQLISDMMSFADRKNEELKISIEYQKGSVLATVSIGKYSETSYKNTINGAVADAYGHIKRVIEIKNNDAEYSKKEKVLSGI